MSHEHATVEQPPGGEVVVYGAAGGAVHVDVRLDWVTVWLTRCQMAGVFDTTPQNVLMHLQNVLADDEPHQQGTVKDFLLVDLRARRRVQRRIGLRTQRIISVGYRINSRAMRSVVAMRHFLVPLVPVSDTQDRFTQRVNGAEGRLACCDIGSRGHISGDHNPDDLPVTVG